jgi:hypothetical protein
MKPGEWSGIASRVLAGSYSGMYVVIILQEAHEDLRNIFAYIAGENPGASQTPGDELLDEAMSLESLPHRSSQSQKTTRPLKTDPWELSGLLPDPRTEKGCRNRSFQAWSTDQMSVLDGGQKRVDHLHNHWPN